MPRFTITDSDSDEEPQPIQPQIDSDSDDLSDMRRMLEELEKEPHPIPIHPGKSNSDSDDLSDMRRMLEELEKEPHETGTEYFQDKPIQKGTIRLRKPKTKRFKKTKKTKTIRLRKPKTRTYRSHKIQPIRQPLNTNTLFVGIYMHGSILTDEKGNLVVNDNYPEGVHITKKNHGGGFGDFTVNPVMNMDSYVYGSMLVNPVTDNEQYVYGSMLNMLHGFDRCVNKKEYDSYVSSVKSRTNRTIPLEANQLLGRKDSCEMFDGLTKYYEKMYGIGGGIGTRKLKYPAIMFMIDVQTDRVSRSFGSDVYTNDIERRMINIVDCTAIELVNFFKIHEKNTGDYERLTHYCEEFVSVRTQYKSDISTSDIFELIGVAAYYLGVKKANILDESCNVICAEEGYAGPTCLNCRLDDVERDPDIGYGGRKSRRKRRLHQKQ